MQLLRNSLKGKGSRCVAMVLLWARWERGTPKTITYFVRLGMVVSTGPCSKSSAAVMPFLVVTECGLPDRLHAGRASS